MCEGIKWFAFSANYLWFSGFARVSEQGNRKRVGQAMYKCLWGFRMVGTNRLCKGIFEKSVLKKTGRISWRFHVNVFRLSSKYALQICLTSWNHFYVTEGYKRNWRNRYACRRIFEQEWITQTDIVVFLNGCIVRGHDRFVFYFIINLKLYWENMMKAVEHLPKGHREIYSIDL